MNQDMLIYHDTIRKTLVLTNPDIFGGCFIATRFIIAQHTELEEKVVKVFAKGRCYAHCIAVTPSGNIIDTQHKQFRLIMKLDESKEEQVFFTAKEHEIYLQGVDV